MKTRFYEIDLLQEYRQSISKRHRGYNRVYQVNLNKADNYREQFNLAQTVSERKQSKKGKSPTIQIAKHCFSQSHNKDFGVTKGIIVRGENAHLNSKQANLETASRKKFTKKRLVRQINTQYQDQLSRENSSQIVSNSVEQFFLNRFKFRKKLTKDNIKLIDSEWESQLSKNVEALRLQPFSPVIKGESKSTHVHSSKKSKTENQTAKQDVKWRRNQNMTELSREKRQLQKCEKRKNSFIPQKPDTLVLKQQSLSNLAQPPKLGKKLQPNLQHNNSSGQKNPTLQHNISPGQKNTNVKVLLPKINCEKQQVLRKQTAFNPELELLANKQKYRKVPLLLRYQSDLKNVDSQSYIVIDADSQAMICGHRSNNTYQIASLTKIMTFHLVLKLMEQHKIQMKSQKVQVQHKSSSVGGTSADLFPGQIYTIQSLLYGLMLPSGNDAALTLAAWGGKFDSSNPQDVELCINQFVKLMNKQARDLNLIDTKFGNPHGLPHKMNRSTALDVAKLCISSMKNPTFNKVVSTKSYKCVATTKQGRKRLNEWENTHKLLRRQGFLGIKTGITVTAGPCLASAYKFKGKTYISVILRAKKISRRFKQTRKILFWCLIKIYGENLSPEETQILKKLKKNNPDLDSDYSQDQTVFRYDRNNTKQLQKRCDIISQM